MASTRDYSIMNSIDNQAGPSVLTPSDGSRTTTITEDTPRLEPSSNRTLRLRGGPRSEQRVAWDEDVVDNEGSGRKSSKSTSLYSYP
jgi:protein phosphatase 1 regulatory subunit 11